MELKIAKEVKKGAWVIGIDEAGRGPVMGPMVYAAVYCPIDFVNCLKEMKVKDSKKLTAKQRKEHFSSLMDTPEMGFVAYPIPAHEISSQMLKRPRVSLNALALEATFKILDEIINLGLCVKHVFVDTLGKPTAHQKRLSSKYPNLNFTVESKADATYSIVSMASIVAKVLRDGEIDKVRSLQDTEIGSGYPSDPNTVRWLHQNVDPVFGFSSDVRFSWSTCSKLLEEKAVKVNWVTEHIGQKRLSDFVKTGASQGRSSFFKTRKLDQCYTEAFKVLL